MRNRSIVLAMSSLESSARRLLDACFGREVDRLPAWMMRQAGRYLPEYREVRSHASFFDLCRTPDLAVEVSLQPFRRFRPDGVIFFSDILVAVEAMGVPVEFGDGGPHLPEPITSASDVRRLARFDPSEKLGFTGEILRTLRREVGDRAAVLGFAGAPWTLASYLVEGGSSKSFATIKRMMGRDPSTLRRLLALLADVVGDVLSFQIASGAQAVQLFDTWAGELTLEDYREWALPAAARAIAGIRRRFSPHPAPSFVEASEGRPLPPSSSEARRAKEEGEGAEPRLDSATAERFSKLALACIDREYPNKPEHVLDSAADAKPPRDFHPAFFGCYDWHSSVHGHWLLARLARRFPEAPFPLKPGRPWTAA